MIEYFQFRDHFQTDMHEWGIFNYNLLVLLAALYDREKIQKVTLLDEMHWALAHYGAKYFRKKTFSTCLLFFPFFMFLFCILLKKLQTHVEMYNGDQCQ